MASCEICGKIATFGNNVSHSKHRTRRRWLPNVHNATFYFGEGFAVKVKACTRCIRTHYKQPKPRGVRAKAAQPS